MLGRLLKVSVRVSVHFPLRHTDTSRPEVRKSKAEICFEIYRQREEEDRIPYKGVEERLKPQDHGRDEEDITHGIMTQEECVEWGSERKESQVG